MSKILIQNENPKIKNSKIITTNNVVLGNFGNLNQNQNISGTGTDITFNGYFKMINFNTNNSSKLKISSVMFALRNIGTNLVRAAIFSDLNGSPNIPIVISEPILFQTINSTSSYKFYFKNYLLSSNTNYWVGMIDRSRWYYQNTNNIITEQNSSGYSVGLIKQSIGILGPWVVASDQNFQSLTSLSIEAIS